jgi:hypothetical protein
MAHPLSPFLPLPVGNLPYLPYVVFVTGRLVTGDRPREGQLPLWHRDRKERVKTKPSMFVLSLNEDTVEHSATSL